MRLKRTATVAGTVLLVGGIGTAAMAAATLSKSVIPANGDLAARTITVSWSGLPALDTVFIEQCNRDGNAVGVVFTPLSDCSQATGHNPSTGATGSGSDQFTIFSGDDPNESGWSCGPGPTSAHSTGLVYDTCYVRLSTGVQSNVATDEFYPITFSTAVDPPPDVPEVPLNVLLPISAAAVLGGGYLVTRKRKLNAAA